MPHLVELHTDAPLSWDEVHARVAAFWDSHDEYGAPLVTTALEVKTCTFCVENRHGKCTGRAGWAGRVTCTCADSHGDAA